MKIPFHVPCIFCCLVMIGLFSQKTLFAAGTTQLASPLGNVIPSNAPFASTTVAGAFNGAQALDNLVTAATAASDNGLLFSGSDTFNNNPQLFAVTGFNAQIGEILIYTLTTDPLRVPASVTIKSSTTSETSLNAGDYETTLATLYPLGLAAFTNSPVVVDPINNPARSDVMYAIVNVGSPVGTQSLYFDFNNDGTVGGNGTRVQELQVIPEPSSIVIMGLGALGFFSFACRRRRK